MKNIVAGYRTMLGKTQQEMADILNVSRQSYYMKEAGKTPFTDKEKETFRDLLKPYYPNITIDDIFFCNHN